MSKEVDERIVSMEFDNKNFENNVKTSMSTLDKLKQALEFKNAGKGLNEIDTASKKINFSQMGNAVESIQLKFSALQVVATTALANITNAAVNAGRDLLNQFAIQPISGGFQEYETQMRSIQTILSNTRWENTNLEQVNSALDELNTYADKTIYNFTEMTRNIGTFTAAGVGLDQSVASIKGIANLAAVSGSSSQQASTAMYQLSQALAAGRVSLMDWNSVVNAGMGGKVFQDALIRTSELMGTGADQAIEKYGTFRESLTQGQWLTTEVLTETLKQISGAYSREELLAQGYTEAQADEIMALAQDAEEAATKVRTFTQLIDTTMEAIGSGWTNTWEILFGDFNEATDLFTEINNVIGAAVQESANARNDLLQGWKDAGGRATLIEGLSNAFDALLSVITPIREAFREIFPPTTVNDLVNLTNQFRDFTASLILDETASANLKEVFKYIFSLIKNIINVFGEAVRLIGSFFTNFTGNAQGFIGMIQNFISGVNDFFSTLSSGISDGTAFQKIINDIGAAFGTFTSMVGDFLNSGIGKLGEILNGITPDTINTFLNALATGGLLGIVTQLKDAISGLGGSFDDLGASIPDALSGLTGGIGDSVTGLLDEVRNALVSWQENIKSTALLKIAVAVALLANAVFQMAALDPQALSNSLGAVTVLFGELVLTVTAFEKVISGLSFGTSGAAALISMSLAINILADALTDISSIDADGITRGVEGIAQLAVILVAATKVLSMGNGTAMKGATQLIIMAAALKVMASAVSDLAQLNMDQMSQGIQGIGALLLEIALFASVIKGGANLMSAAASMILVGTALKILASSVYDIGSLDTGKAVQGVSAIGAVLAEIAAFSRVVNGTELLKAFAPLMGISVALLVVSGSLIALGSLDGTQIVNSVAAIGIVLGEIAAFTNLLPNGRKLIAVAVVLPSLAGSLITFSIAIRSLSELNIEQVGTALAGFAGSMLTLLLAVKVLSGNASAIPALAIAAVSLVAIAGAIGLLATVGLPGIVIALGSLASTFIVLGVAAKVLGPLAPTMIKLSLAIASFGLSLISIGVGSAALGVGLSVAVAAIVTALANIQGAISSIDPAKAAIAIGVLVASFVALGVAAKFIAPLLPSLHGLALTLLNFGIACAAVSVSIYLIATAFNALGSMNTETVSNAMENVKSMILGLVDLLPGLLVGVLDTLKTLIVGVLGIIVELAPQIADSLLKVITEILSSLNEYGPQIIDFVLSFVIQIINGVAARIPELVGAISNLVGQLFTAIMDAMSGWGSTEGGTDAALKFLAGATGLVVAFNLIKGLIPGAMAGAVGMAAFIVEIGAILAALGALQQITGVSEFINSGGDLLQSIGTALGQFIGGFVGGAFEGLTSTLPQVATSLSQFMMNLTPFLVGVKMVDPTILDSIGALTGCILALTAANVLNAIGTFLTGGTDIGKFAQQLIPFGEAVVQFSDVVSGINAEAVTAAAAAGQALASLAQNLPKEGGLAQAIFGETTDLGDFATQLVTFGIALKAYSIAVAGMDTESVVASAQAGQALSDLAQSLPKDGGLAQAIFGESTDLDEFGAQLVSFGVGLRLYAATVAGLDIASIQNSVGAGQALADLSNSLGDKDSVFGWLAGGNKQDLSGFSDQLTTFGQALVDFGGKISEVDFGTITTATNRTNTIVQLMKNAVDLDTSGVENIEKMTDIGQSLYDYYYKISSVDQGLIYNSISNLESLKSFIGSLVGFDTSGVASFTSAVTQLGQTSLDSLVAVFQEASLSDAGTNLMGTLATGIQNGQSAPNGALQIIIDGMKTSIAQKDIDFQSTGSNSITAYASGISNSTSAVSNAVSAVVNAAVSGLGNHYQTFYDTGANLARGFSNGIRDSAYLSRIEAAAMANAAATAAQQALNEHSPSRVMARIGEFAGMGFANGFKPFVEVAGGIGNKMGTSAVDGVRMAVAAINTLDDDFTIKPRIVPVIDTKAMSDNMRILNQGFRTSSAVVAQIDGINARIVDAQMAKYPQSQNGANTGTNISFTQYNNSPKALSSIDIYRQTRNQLSRLKNGGLKQ